MTPTPQVAPSHYIKPGYLTKDRWLNYWYQLSWVRKCAPKTVLEIGIGNGLVKTALERLGIIVETADIDAALKPTYTASVTKLPVPDASYDFVLCAEVLEHLPFEESLQAMKELHRVSRRYALVTLPHAGYVFAWIFKLPLLPWIELGFKLPHWWKTHIFQGEHYWELGKKTWSRQRIKKELEGVGFRVLKTQIHPDDPGHVFYLCEKRTSV
jgi:SAM-dependent methyltransferase